MRTSPGQARLRRTYAVLAGLLWLLGVEVLPNIHLALHSGAKPHTHTANGMVVTVTFDRDAEPHRHEDGNVHTHDQTAKKARNRTGELAIDRVPDAHVASGLAHHALALHAAPPPILDAVAVDRVVTEHLAIECGRDSVALIVTCDARGPPAV